MYMSYTGWNVRLGGARHRRSLVK